MKRLFTTFTLLTLGAFPAITNAQVSLTNPLGEADPRILIGRVINGALSISGSLALVMIIYAGFLWMTAQGNEQAVKKGKDILVWSILGIIIIASAYVVTNAIFQAVLTGNVGG